MWHTSTPFIYSGGMKAKLSSMVGYVAWWFCCHPSKLLRDPSIEQLRRSTAAHLSLCHATTIYFQGTILIWNGCRKMLNRKLSRNWAVAVIADPAVCEVWISCKLLARIAVVSIGIYLFTCTVSNWTLLLMLEVSLFTPLSFLANHCVLWLDDTSYIKHIWRSK